MIQAFPRHNGISHTDTLWNEARSNNGTTFICDKIIEQEPSFPKLSLACANAPTISKCLTLFHNKLRLSAATIARFYLKCTLDRIRLEMADKVSLM